MTTESPGSAKVRKIRSRPCCAPLVTRISSGPLWRPCCERRAEISRRSSSNPSGGAYCQRSDLRLQASDSVYVNSSRGKNLSSGVSLEKSALSGAARSRVAGRRTPSDSAPEEILLSSAAASWSERDSCEPLSRSIDPGQSDWIDIEPIVLDPLGRVQTICLEC